MSIALYQVEILLNGLETWRINDRVCGISRTLALSLSSQGRESSRDGYN